MKNENVLFKALYRIVNFYLIQSKNCYVRHNKTKFYYFSIFQLINLCMAVFNVVYIYTYLFLLFKILANKQLKYNIIINRIVI